MLLLGRQTYNEQCVTLLLQMDPCAASPERPAQIWGTQRRVDESSQGQAFGLAINVICLNTLELLVRVTYETCKTQGGSSSLFWC